MAHLLSRIPQQANIVSFSGFRKCKWIPQNVSGIRKYKQIPQTVNRFRNLFITELAYQQLKAGAGELIFSNPEFECKDLIIVNGIHVQILKHWSTKSVDVIF